MSEIKVDTQELRTKYPFLDKIWTSYEEFNQDIDPLDNQKGNYDAMCQAIMIQVNKTEKRYKDICTKLIRNIGTFSSERNTDKYNSERCQNLNRWLYYIIKEYDVPQNIFTNIFDQSNRTMWDSDTEHYCLNYLYKDKYEDPDDIINLINLENYVNDILSILKNNKNDKHCSCREFIFECANIYKKLNKIYCTSPTKDSSKKSNTCSKLQDFNTFYTKNIFKNVEVKGKLPSLDVAENEHIPPCPSDMENQEPRRVQNQAFGSGLRPGPQTQDISDNAEQTGSTIPFNATAVFGTMAGIPPFLALIYKFTPIGTWFRSKNRKGTDAFKHLDEEIEKQLYYPRHENTIINSGHARYNVAYEQL